MSFYGLATARRGLVHYAAGKLASALLGVALLVLMVRRMDAAAYGGYVAALALAELFYLATGLGLSTVAQRYVAEYRLKAPAAEFTRFLAGQFARRLLHSAVGVALLLLGWRWVMPWTGLAWPMDQAPMLCLLLVAYATSSFLDEVLGSVLLQGLAQLLAMARNLLRLLAILGLSGAAGLPLGLLLWAEGLILLVTGLAGTWLVLRWAMRHGSAPGAVAGFRPPGMAAVCRRFYVVQLAGQLYGVNVTKLLLARLQGLAQTATFGVAQSVADMVRNYMPAQLLAGWIRPLMVARYVAHRDIDQLCLVANMAFKANLLGLLPMLALCVTVGDPLVSAVSGGRYGQIGQLLAVLVLGLILQSAHLLLTMVALTIESPSASLRATGLAAATLPLVAWLVYAGGAMGAAWAGVLTELVWVCSAFWVLRSQGHRVWVDLPGAARLAAAGCAALLVGALAGWLQWPLALGVVLQLGLFALVLALLRPINAAELELLRRFLGRQQSAS